MTHLDVKVKIRRRKEGDAGDTFYRAEALPYVSGSGHVPSLDPIDRRAVQTLLEKFIIDEEERAGYVKRLDDEGEIQLDHLWLTAHEFNALGF